RRPAPLRAAPRESATSAARRRAEYPWPRHDRQASSAADRSRQRWWGSAASGQAFRTRFLGLWRISAGRKAILPRRVGQAKRLAWLSQAAIRVRAVGEKTGERDEIG